MEDQSITQGVVQQVLVNNYYSLAAAALLYYEYILTFEEEVRFFWGRKHSFVTVLFFTNRYVSLVANAVVIVHNLGDLSAETCNRLHGFNQIFIVVVQCVVGSISAIRVYALYGHSRRVVLVLAISVTSGIVVGLWSIIGKADDAFDISSSVFGCHSALTDHEGKRYAIAWIMLLLYDTVILALTFWKALAEWKLGPSQLFDVVVRDGSMYFFGMGMANLSNVITFELAPPILKGVSTSFANVFAAIMISRLMINIQSPKLFGSATTVPTADADTFFALEGIGNSYASTEATGSDGHDDSNSTDVAHGHRV